MSIQPQTVFLFHGTLPYSEAKWSYCWAWWDHITWENGDLCNSHVVTCWWRSSFYAKIILTELAHPILIRSWKILMKENHEYLKDNSLLVKYLNSALLLLSFCPPSSLCQCLSWGTQRCTNCSPSSKHCLWFPSSQLWSKDLMGGKAPSCRTIFVRSCQNNRAYPPPLHSHWHGFLVGHCCQNNPKW